MYSFGSIWDDFIKFRENRRIDLFKTIPETCIGLIKNEWLYRHIKVATIPNAVSKCIIVIVELKWNVAKSILINP
ncbi:hypothetical protein WN55_01030 [Dufourea novaeangliae]|uniref:Uncharacterized protein n=1 Tax=Dufourea novaeangliae TaxID=178035 RepID=A0A154PDR8_DUFNO|nr:hypothetical protein WN55_01030 [Dufourea novaeangliae]